MNENKYLAFFSAMSNFVVITYSIGAALFFRAWLNVLNKDRNLSKEEKRLSWIILIIATIVWPIVVPSPTWNS